MKKSYKSFQFFNNFSKIFNVKIFLFVFLFILVACNVNHTAKSSGDKGLQSVTQQSQPKIVYFFFEIEKSSPLPIIKLQEKKITDGFVKSEILDQRRERGETYLKIDLLSSDQKIVKSILMDNPLSPIMESYGTSGIEKQQANFERSEFSVRFNQDLDTKINHINIYQVKDQTSNLLYNQNF